MIVGALFIAYGVIIGLVGQGPDGPVTSFQWRIVGLGALVLGILYFLSNKTVSGSFRFTLFYLLATFCPCLALIVLSLISVFDQGLAVFAREGGLVTMLVLIPFCLFAPASLILFLKQKETQGKKGPRC